jgi:hypothetical protein
MGFFQILKYSKIYSSIHPSPGAERSLHVHVTTIASPSTATTRSTATTTAAATPTVHVYVLE